jgi:hypothetical protein
MGEKKTCFVIAPIGRPGSAERSLSDRVFKHIIEPAATLCGYTSLAAKELPGSGLIMAEVIRNVLSAPLVIADLTGGNANVSYELALRHAVRRPVVQIIAKKNERIKFDFSQIRTIIFDINDVNSESQIVATLAEYIQEAVNRPPETPISAAQASIWIPFPEDGSPQSTRASSPKHIDEVRIALDGLSDAEAIPLMWEYIDELLRNPRVQLLDRPIDDLSAACALVNNVPKGGQISATSSLQNEDADEQPGYRTAVNLALERRVKYRKVICFSIEQWPERHKKWLGEFTDKAKLIKERAIKADAFELLHYPEPMSVDVLISQASQMLQGASAEDRMESCREMVAGFAGGEGHGGFRTDDKKMVYEWLDIYLERKVIAEAKQHTEKVIEDRGGCRCWMFLQLLEDARLAVASSVKPVHRKRQPGAVSKG